MTITVPFQSEPTPTAAPLHARVLRRDRLVEPAYHQKEQPVCEPTGERPRLRSGVASADEAELVDLVRLHAPTPDVVIVRVSGTVNRRGAQLLAELARKQLNRAPHVVIDLANVSVLGPRGVAALLTLHQEAMALGTDLRIVGADHEAVHRPLRVTGLTQLLSFDSTADAVIASLPVRQVRGRPLDIGVNPHAVDPAGNQHDRQSARSRPRPRHVVFSWRRVGSSSDRPPKPDSKNDTY
jgi:anti-anti-sigma factor